MPGALDGWIDIFREGRWTDSQGHARTWTAEDLARIVQRYETADPAPVVIGHPEQADPAYGWVDRIRLVGGTLQARLRDLQPDFRRSVESGRYSSRSVAVDPTDMTLVHLAFLGARRPAVPGMAPTSFALPSAACTYALPAPLTFAAADEAASMVMVLQQTIARVRSLARRIRDYVIDVHDIDRADRVVSPAQLDHLDGLDRMADDLLRGDDGSPFPALAADGAVPSISTGAGTGATASGPGEHPAARQTASLGSPGDAPAGIDNAGPSSGPATEATTMNEAEMQAAMDTLKRERAAFEREQRRAAAHSAARTALAEHVAHGRVLAHEVPALTELLTYVSLAETEEATLTYAADGGGERRESARDVLLGYIARQPQRVQFGELALGAVGRETSAADADPTVPARARMLMSQAAAAGAPITEVQAVDMARAQAGLTPPAQGRGA